jgi:hypothetical protein
VYVVVCIQQRRAEAPEKGSVTEGVEPDTVHNLKAEVVRVVGQAHLRANVDLGLR